MWGYQWAYPHGTPQPSPVMVRLNRKASNLGINKLLLPMAKVFDMVDSLLIVWGGCSWQENQEQKECSETMQEPSREEVKAASMCRECWEWHGEPTIIWYEFLMQGMRSFLRDFHSTFFFLGLQMVVFPNNSGHSWNPGYLHGSLVAGAALQVSPRF